MSLKVAIFCLRDVIGSQSSDAHKSEIVKLLRYLHSIGVQPAFYSMRHWKFGDVSAEDAIGKLAGFNIPYFCCDRDGLPARQKAGALDPILKTLNVQKNEVVLIGNTKDDMIAGVNNNILFLNATWYGEHTDYGFRFSTPKELAKFLGIFCTRQHYWFFGIGNASLRMVSLGPFTTKLQEYAGYGADARRVAKTGYGRVEFWTYMLVSSLYFSGLYEEIDYVAPYPGHEKGIAQTVVEEPLITFAKCFRKTYLPDLFERHTTAPKSQTLRIQGKQPLVSTQLSTIKLNPTPQRYSGKKYKATPLTKGKCVLVVDDICTSGNSLEAARAYIGGTGASVVLLAWLKTINTPYRALQPLPKLSPYNVNTFKANPPTSVYGYQACVSDPAAPDEIAERFASYANWNWPAGI